MYKILTVEDTVRVPPRRFNEDLNTVVLSELENSIVGKIDKEIGIILAVVNLNSIGEGKIILGDGAIYYDVVFDILVYQPVLNEVVEGYVSEIAEFGAFINFGPMDGLVHVSQITEDYMSYDSRNMMLIGKETRKILRVGDNVRVRIIAISLKPRFSDSKIGLTMRQPYLGKLEWLEEEKKRLQKEKEDKEKREGKK
ncbi:MAG: DNA-directed RNA polymerase [Candidatus Altiarchaeales archaeon]|nr:MAG: DNA-directed RNA polymerase [Candidatus Altiarchaeales archaeon]RLI94733.1 MAG: DNA-directed RNA polymerase [Candidatus Altiarchaeales archaeon]RLI94835.1 MAG: DNA-directed RNA polymerase [Candidatus Altiarchaeales archaeon]HDO82695.1 DNA-directed RNA polymerase [Candidatus Altiarchaeales archaeon]HEX55344.1 DNA-directed RNA polymerase [Candidatus Altiarchaeales archaeon]